MVLKEAMVVSAETGRPFRRNDCTECGYFATESGDGSSIGFFHHFEGRKQ